MKKEIVIASTALLLMTTPVFAANTTHGKNADDTTTTEAEVTVAPTATQGCDPSLSWKNHGAYVECVAHLHQGGQTVSDAAKSDVGKKSGSVSGTVTPTISISPTISATSSPTPTDASISGTVTPTGTGSGTLTTEALIEKPIHGLGHFFQSIFSFFAHLI